MRDDPGAILIVDDEFSVRDSLARWLRKDGYEVVTAEDGLEALRQADRRSFDAAILDIKMPGMDGLEVQSRLLEREPELPTVMITAYASVDTAVRALKRGAFDYVTKPVDPEELSHLVSRAIEQRRLRRENSQLRKTIDDLVSVDQIIGESPAIRKVMELVGHVAATDATVLITGESGTGKELIARAIHANSERRYRPIIPVNCGAVPDALLESELFGHEKGAFTGADHQRKGKIEMADGGTLFLDEIGVIPARMQIELLRVLEDRMFTRLGGSEQVHSDFRVICATNEDLESAVRDGRFREDLFYRINVFTIEAPPLRERRSDIPLLAEYFLNRFGRQMDREITSISPEAMDLLLRHDWPGNIRELCNAIERAMVVGTPPEVRCEDLPIGDRVSRSAGVCEALSDIERRHIEAVLNRTDWNITRAAKILEIDRVTVYNKIRKFGIERGATGAPSCQ